MKQNGNLLFLWWATCLLWWSCSDDDFDLNQDTVTTTARVCVVVPESEISVWKNDVDWALSNFKQAQSGLSHQIQIEVDWVDEEAADIEQQLKRVAADTGYVAIIGPTASTIAYTAAVECGKSQKPLILPIATSVEFQRLFAGKDYVWNLTQSDITQCEILLAQALLSECDTVSLITSDDYYGQSFSDWFAYQATELGLTVEAVEIYTSDESLREAIKHHAHTSDTYTTKMLLFAPSKEHDAIIFDEEYGRIEATTQNLVFPLLLCSDVVNAPALRTQLTHRTYEGIAPCANPMSGFDNAYKVHFNQEPMAGEAHLYDAVTLVAYALTAREGDEDMNDVIRRVVDGRETWNASWLPTDMQRTLLALRAGMEPDLSGVSGDWTFDARTHASVLNTTYSHWILKDGAYTTLEYLSSDGSGRTTSTMQAWEEETSKYQEFNQNQKDVSYSALEGHYAVVIGTSDTWANYRHQADALAMYQLLKRHGYDDDHIILIIADNLAYDSHNIYPGNVHVRPDGENVYEGAVVDYRLGDITISDLDSILTGRSSDRLPQTLQSGSGDNVIVFWCGHGTYGRLAWGSYDEVGGDDVANLFRHMKEEKRFRKLLLSVDACYSGSIGEACQGIPGLLSITAATPYEPSKADMKDLTMGIWLSNAFTRVFQETIDESPNISIRNLYYYLARATTGSHVTVYNETLYGNLYNNTMTEFLWE